MWKLNNILLNNQQVKKEVTRKIRKYLNISENENTTYENLRYAVKAVLRGKIIAVNAHIKKDKRSQINNIIFTLRDQKKSKLNPKQEESNKD